MQMASTAGGFYVVCVQWCQWRIKGTFWPLKREIIETSQPPEMHTGTFKVKQPPNNKTLDAQKSRDSQTHTIGRYNKTGESLRLLSRGRKEKDPPDVPEGTDQSRPDWLKLFVLDSTSITIQWSCVSDCSTAERKGRAFSIRPWRNRFTPLDL